MPHFTVRGQPPDSLCLKGVASFQDADRESLVFVTNPKFLQSGLQSAAGVLLTSEKIWEKAGAELPEKKVLLLHPNPDLALATLIRKYFGRNIRASSWWKGVHPQASLAPDVKLGQNVIVAPGASIGSGCELGDDVYVGSNVTVEENAQIGARTILHPNAMIGHSCQIGADCEILPNTTIGSEGFGYAHTPQGEHHRIPHLGKVIIEDRVDIGANCSIDRGTLQDTVIGSGTKMDNLCHVAHNCRIGKNCLITAHFIAAGSVTIGDNVVIGGRTSIAGHLKIGNNIHLAALTAITNNMDQPGQYGGHPAQPLQAYLKSTASIAQLPEMRKQLSKLMKRVFSEKHSPEL